MPHAFISHGKSDGALALRVAFGLESNGAPCWIAPRDIPPAEDYADALEAGVSQAQVVVFLASAESMSSRFCKAELEIARTDDVPILPVLLDGTPITGGWRIYLSGHQWLPADGNEEAWIADLAGALKRLGVSEDEGSSVASDDQSSNAAATTEAMLERFESYDSVTQARKVLEHMLATGWTAHLPQARPGATTQASYIRLTRQGKRRATAYLNSASLFVAGKHEKSVLTAAPGAVVQASGIYVDHSPSSRGGSLEAAVGAAALLTAWVEGVDASAPEQGGGVTHGTP